MRSKGLSRGGDGRVCAVHFACLAAAGDRRGARSASGMRRAGRIHVPACLCWLRLFIGIRHELFRAHARGALVIRHLFFCKGGLLLHHRLNVVRYGAASVE